MKCVRRIKGLIIACILLSTMGNVTAQTGLHPEGRKNFLIPMVIKEELVGHAYVYFLDRKSKDSNTYVIQVFDEYLHEVGEKKFNVSSGVGFDKATFNGKEVVLKFNHTKNKTVQYLFFDQKGELVTDTLLQNAGRIATYKDHKNYIAESFHSIDEVGTLDYFQTQIGNKDCGSLQYLGKDKSFWQYVDQGESSIQYLFADKNYIVNTVYHYRKDKYGNDTRTSIMGMSTPGGKVMFETSLNDNDSVCIYPIAAHLSGLNLEIISEFTSHSSKYGRLKFGICTHTLDLNGHITKTNYNLMTASMLADSVVKKNKLLTFSYLFMHKAIRLKNGNWLVAAEQFKRVYSVIRLFKNNFNLYGKKSLVLMEVQPDAIVNHVHVVPNKLEGILVKPKYIRQPHNGGISILERGRTDISYFIRDNQAKGDKISFVFTDLSGGESRRLALGSILFEDGQYKQDKFNVPLKTIGSRVAIIPARFGHVILYRYIPELGITDFDNIKFNHAEPKK